MHSHLTDRLAHLSWSRSQIWKNSTSVHSWELGEDGPTLAFDVYRADDSVTVTLVVRQVDWADRVGAGLRKEKIPFTRHRTRHERFLVHTARIEGQLAPTLDEVVGVVQRVRSAIATSVWDEQEWQHPESGLTVPFTVKPERKSNRELIFLFSSIRTKHHWQDFNGPNGETLKTNRARIVFLPDNFAKTFTYHLAIDGDHSILKATIAFVKHYVQTEGYDWQQVTLSGMSKGATSALVVGSALPSCTIAALAPQLDVGGYLLDSRKAILTTITGGAEPHHAELANRLMWDSIATPQGPTGIARCYLLTSNGDPHCTSGIERLEAVFDESPNRLVVFTDQGEHTQTHLETVHFLMPLLVSLLGLISLGSRPTAL